MDLGVLSLWTLGVLSLWVLSLWNFETCLDLSLCPEFLKLKIPTLIVTKMVEICIKQ